MRSEATMAYVASLWSSPKVEQVEVSRLTDASYWLADSPDRRRARETSYEQLYLTFDEAKERVIAVQRKEVAKCESRLRNAQDRLTAARNLCE